MWRKIRGGLDKIKLFALLWVKEPNLKKKSMKRIFPKLSIAFALGLFTIGSLCAQTPNNYTLRVLLVDSLSKTPIEFATVAVYEGESKTVSKFAISDRRGAAEILGIKRGEHTVKIDLMGYTSRTQKVSFTEQISEARP